MSNPARPQARDGIGARAIRFKPVDVVVTAGMIAKSVRRDSSACVVADPLKTLFPGSIPSADLAQIRYSDREAGFRYTFLTPPIAQDVLIRFDQGFPIEPFTYRLQKPILVQPIRRRAKRQDVEEKPTVVAARPSRRRLGTAKPGGNNIPIILGGPSLPNGPLATTKGRVRAYGLKQLRA